MITTRRVVPIFIYLQYLVGTVYTAGNVMQCLTTVNKYLGDPKCETYIDTGMKSGSSIALMTIDCYGTAWTDVKLAMDGLARDMNNSVSSGQSETNKTAVTSSIALGLYFIEFESVSWRLTDAYILPGSLRYLTIGHSTNLTIDKFVKDLKGIEQKPQHRSTNVVDTREDSSGAQPEQQIEANMLPIKSLTICSTSIKSNESARTWDEILSRKFFYLGVLAMAGLTPNFESLFKNNKLSFDNKYMYDLNLNNLGIRILPANMFIIRYAKGTTRSFKISMRGNPIERIEKSFLQFDAAISTKLGFKMILDLSDCKLTKKKIAPNSFSFLNTDYLDMVEFDLRLNELTIIHRELFEDLLRHGNRFGRGYSRIKLIIDENPVDCYHCGNEWLVKNRLLKEQIYGLKCGNGTDSEEMRYFDTLTEDDFPDCSSGQTTIFTFLAIMILFIAAVGILMTLFTLIALFSFGIGPLPWQASSSVSGPKSPSPTTPNANILPLSQEARQISTITPYKTDQTRIANSQILPSTTHSPSRNNPGIIYTKQRGSSSLEPPLDSSSDSQAFIGAPPSMANKSRSTSLEIGGRRITSSTPSVIHSDLGRSNMATVRTAGGLSSMLDLGGRIHVLPTNTKAL